MTDARALLAEARRELARFAEVLPRLVEGLDGPTWRARPQPDEWSALEIVCHLRDEETLDFGARLRVIVEDGEAFERIDPERLAAGARYRESDPPAVLAAFVSRRQASLEWLATIPLDRLTETRARPSGGRLSGLDLLAAWVAHDRLHLQQLAGTLARVWADRWAPLDAGYAGTIPYGETVTEDG